MNSPVPWLVKNVLLVVSYIPNVLSLFLRAGMKLCLVELFTVNVKEYILTLGL